jgi:Lrp/AsnC family transcriptional regulator, regulator for asnA, asnC and gidA
VTVAAAESTVRTLHDCDFLRDVGAGAMLASVPRPGATSTVVIDEVDKSLIEALQRDGRLPYTRLASEVGLSEAAVRQRVQRLIESGVTQIVAVTDPLTLGFHRMAMVGLRVEGDVRQAADTLDAIPEVDYVVIVAGSLDLLVEIVCEDDDHLLSLLNDKIRTIPGVRSTETFTYLRLYKQTYAWGTR